MKNDRKEDVFVARRLGRAYDVSGRSSMTSFMDGGTVLVRWDFSHWYEWSLCIVFGAMKWWMVAVGGEILAHVFKFVECRKGRCGRVVKIHVDVVEPRYKVNDHFLISTTTLTNHNKYTAGMQLSPHEKHSFLLIFLLSRFSSKSGRILQPMLQQFLMS